MDMCQTVTRRSVLCIGNDAGAERFSGKRSPTTSLSSPQRFRTIRSMNSRAFDAYVTDFWLQDWAGPQLCRAIRDLDPHCPIIFWTASDSDQNRHRAMRAGASAYFCREADEENVRPTLRTLLARADEKSLAAKARLEATVVSEIERCKARLRERAASAGDIRGTFVERTARTRGYKVFLGSGGSRAHFERWWPAGIRQRARQPRARVGVTSPARRSPRRCSRLQGTRAQPPAA